MLFEIEKLAIFVCFYRVIEGDEERMAQLALQVQLVLLDSRYHCCIYSVFQCIYSGFEFIE